jgi:Cu2+-exporting ATPase
LEPRTDAALALLNGLDEEHEPSVFEPLADTPTESSSAKVEVKIVEQRGLEGSEARLTVKLRCQIKHSIRGRLRVAFPHLSSQEDLMNGLKRYVSSKNGITSVEISYLCGSMTIEYDFKALKKTDVLNIVVNLTLKDIMQAQENLLAVRVEDHETSLFFLRLATVGVAASLLFMGLPAVGAALVFPYLIYISMPIYLRAYRVWSEERRLNVDFLDAMAITVGMLTGDVFNASAMVWLIHLGDYIRDLTASTSQRTIRKLLDFQDHYAWVVRDAVEVRIKVRDIVEGDVVALHVGDLIPIDGELVEGELIVDQQVLTGESMPIHKEVGDLVFASTVIRDGKAYVRATRIGDSTKVAQVVRMVEEAPMYETKIQNHAEKFADRLVVPSLMTSGLLFLPTMNLAQLTALLTVDFGTGIRVSAPTAVLSCMISAASNGIVIKGGRYLEILCQADTIVFDKTGTLTTGVIHVEDIVNYNGYTASEVLSLAASAEMQLTHPIAEAVVRSAANRDLLLRRRDDVKYIVGRGVHAAIEGKEVLVGSLRLLREYSIPMDGAVDAMTNHFIAEGKACLYVAIDRELSGIIALRDQIRPEAKDMIDALHKVGVSQVIMLTGDVKQVAMPVAKSLGVDRCIAEMLPEQKAEVIMELKKEGHIVAFVGDGINDSVGLSYADIGFSVKTGADITKETAGVILLSDNLLKIAKAFEISRETMQLIKQNYGITASFNVVAYGLAALAMLSPVLTTLISNGSAVVACVNGMRPIMRLKMEGVTESPPAPGLAHLPAS